MAALEPSDEDDEYLYILDQSAQSRKRNNYRMSNAYAFILAIESTTKIPRTSSYFRKRWDSVYLRDLAEKENSFISEYRLSPKLFDTLHEMLFDSLTVNNEMAARAMSNTKSDPISPSSRLGATLIMLGGGRRIEAMRTHGLSQPFAYQNFKRVVKAINRHPGFILIFIYNTFKKLYLV